MAKLQVALYSEDRSPASILGAVADLVHHADTASQARVGGVGWGGGGWVALPLSLPLSLPPLLPLARARARAGAHAQS